MPHFGSRPRCSRATPSRRGRSRPRPSGRGQHLRAAYRGNVYPPPPMTSTRGSAGWSARHGPQELHLHLLVLVVQVPSGRPASPSSGAGGRGSAPCTPAARRSSSLDPDRVVVRLPGDAGVLAGSDDRMNPPVTPPRTMLSRVQQGRLRPHPGDEQRRQGRQQPRPAGPSGTRRPWRPGRTRRRTSRRSPRRCSRRTPARPPARRGPRPARPAGSPAARPSRAASIGRKNRVNVQTSTRATSPRPISHSPTVSMSAAS